MASRFYDGGASVNPRIIFLVEELSIRKFLEALLPRLFPYLSYLIIHHDGKQDLENRLQKRLVHWNITSDFFMVIRDKDGDDCIALKQRLLEKCHAAGKHDAVVRIACHELESWYLGDLNAVAQAYQKPAIRNKHGKGKFRNPDVLVNPSQELGKIVSEFRKVSGASLMGATLNAEGNLSRSYQVLLQGIHKIQALSSWNSLCH